MPKRKYPFRQRQKKVDETQIKLVTFSKKFAISTVEATQNDAKNHKEDVECSQCSLKIQFKAFECCYCSYHLCLPCFQNAFPTLHEHPRNSFKIVVMMKHVGEDTEKAQGWAIDYQGSECGLKFEKDVVWPEDVAIRSLSDIMTLCALCGFTKSDEETGEFIPLAFAREHRGHQSKFYVHDLCARTCPEVFQDSVGQWYNVGKAVRRARRIRCSLKSCKQKGAGLGCFEFACGKSFHVGCTEKDVDFFKKGYVFFCPEHDASYDDVYSCDDCGDTLNGQNWLTCTSCRDYSSSFDLCQTCFTKVPFHHSHDSSHFATINLESYKQPTLSLEAKPEKMSEKRPPKIRCAYCASGDAGDGWQFVHETVMICSKCSSLHVTPKSTSTSLQLYPSRRMEKTVCETTAPKLRNYQPPDRLLFTLVQNCSYHDIVDRAIKWASHDEQFYLGTWLPHVPRITLLRYTLEDDKVLSMFLGRGTDAVEALLLKRRLVGVDVNPLALNVSKKSLNFSVSSKLGINGSHIPVLIQGDARDLGKDFPKDFDFILCHPPYGSAITYSNNDADLSQFTDPFEFQSELSKVAGQAFKVLKVGGRLILGMGDARQHRFILPHGLMSIETFIDAGFELEELIIRRQRFCRRTPLGEYLSVKYDFFFTEHEYLGVFRKIQDGIPRGDLKLGDCKEMMSKCRTFKLPYVNSDRRRTAMGSAWSFPVNNHWTLPRLVTAKIVERFGKDFDGFWDLVEMECNVEYEISSEIEHVRDEGDCEMEDVSGLIDWEQTFWLAFKNGTSIKLPEKRPIPTISVSEYEQVRLQAIQNNMKMLQSLGLPTTTGHSFNDEGFMESTAEFWTEMMRLDKLVHVFHGEREAKVIEGVDGLVFSSPAVKPNSQLIVIPHIEFPPTAIFNSTEWLSGYRRAISRHATMGNKSAQCFVVGVKDVRIFINSHYSLYPLSLLVFQDVSKILNNFKLKEIIVATPTGYSREKNKESIEQVKLYLQREWLKSKQTTESERLGIQSRKPLAIIHSIYLIYKRL